MHLHLTPALATERHRDLIAAAERAKALAPARRRRRRALLAVLPAALVAALPAVAQAADQPNGSTFVGVADDGTLNVHATSSGGVQGPPPIANNIHVRIQGSSIRVVDALDDVQPAGPSCLPISRSEATCSLSKVTRIDATLDASFAPAADDTWRSDTALPTTVSGGRGNDTVVRGLFNGFSRLEVHGGDGFDRVEYLLASSGVAVSKDEQANDGRPGTDADNIHGDIEWLLGSLHDDTLSGDNADRTEFIEGMAGDDELFGNAGNDVFRAGAAADGADRMLGGDGIDTVNYADRTQPVTANLSDGGADDGEAGERDEIRQVETARGGSAGDTLRAHPDGTTPVTLVGLGGGDMITGARGGDTLNGGSGIDTISGNAGNDLIQARDGERDTVSCGSEFDTADIENGLDLFSGCEKFEQIGVLRLTPRRIVAQPGKPARLKLSWRHPDGWRKLRSITLRLTRDGVAAGQVTIRPRGGRIDADGEVTMARRATRLTRRGKTVTARLALRIDASMTGQTLGLEVEATDSKGRRQLERDAGAIRIAQ